MHRSENALPLLREHRWLVIAASVIVVAQLVTMYTLRRTERVPSPSAFSEMPQQLTAEWGHATDLTVSDDVVLKLGADELLDRTYEDLRTGSSLELFIAYYRSQFRDTYVHSPKVCLPAWGWTALNTAVTAVDMGNGDRITINSYLVSRSDNTALVLYWYQTHKKAIAGEYALKVFRVMDTLIDHRSDMAFVRVVAPVRDHDIGIAEARAKTFVRSIYPFIRARFPSLTTTVEHREGL